VETNVVRKNKSQIVLASNNLDKLREFQHLMRANNIELLPQSQFDVPEAEETGLTFVENAILKARQASSFSSLPALADDSGLEVDALHGAPGVRSARFAGEKASYAENVDKLLEMLSETPEEQRTARFHCLLVYLRHKEDSTPLICHGVWEGHILLEPRGKNGFGYDPVFFVPTHNCSAAELSAGIKNQISHRAQAFNEFLRKFFV
jgi:XTP/dITP diphosphohydrolase